MDDKTNEYKGSFSSGQVADPLETRSEKKPWLGDKELADENRDCFDRERLGDRGAPDILKQLLLVILHQGIATEALLEKKRSDDQ